MYSPVLVSSPALITNGIVAPAAGTSTAAAGALVPLASLAWAALPDLSWEMGRAARAWLSLLDAGQLPRARLAWSLYYTGRHEQALDALQRALRAAPQGAGLYNGLGWCLLRLDAVGSVMVRDISS